MGIDRIVMKAGVLSGRLVYKGFEHFTSNAKETQEKLLKKLMRDNADTEYGKKYDFAHISTPEEYREKVPFSTYATYAEDVQRMIRGEKNILTS
ncbi:MAG: GH3 auxin-responsive promoter family protein, partial [Clostridia bacterium]|nr:GH3 auxin-responsive promoter family protein [Clostridia bacterium]